MEAITAPRAGEKEQEPASWSPGRVGSGVVASASGDAVPSDWTNGYGLLASALAGRRMAVALTEGAAYTDGETIFLSADQGEDSHRLVALAVQACLLCSGSLDPKVLCRLVGHRQAALRYFSLEVARASGCAQSRLPRTLSGVLGAHRIEHVPDSPEESFERAFRRDPIPLPPECFGTIRPKEVIRGAFLAEGSAPAPGDYKGVAQQSSLPEIEDEDEAEESRLLKLLSAPIGQQVPLAKLLQRLFGGGRRRRGDSSAAGAEIPVSGMMAVSRVGSRARLVAACPGLNPDKRAARVDGIYPEWDWEARRYRRDWCWVTEYDAPSTPPNHPISPVRDADLRRRLARIGLSLERHRRQTEGDALDLDPLVDLMVGRAMGQSGDDRVYQSRRKTAHDLGALLLLDTSGSTGERHWGGQRTYDEQRQITANLAMALEEIGDRVAVFGFNSQGRQAVQLQRVKDFDDRFDHVALRRLGALEPSGYTRLGAAIRHGLHLVTKKSGTSNRLLVVISDGFPFDDGYEDTYAERDTRQALAEGRLNGVGVVCLSVATSTRQEALERVFGTSAYAHLAHASDMNEHIEGVLRSAVRLASGTQHTQTRHEQQVGLSAGSVDLHKWAGRRGSIVPA